MVEFKSIEVKPKTVKIVFEIDNENDIKKLKALCILTGGYNPFRKDMIDHNLLYEVLMEQKKNLSFNDFVEKLIPLLK